MNRTKARNRKDPSKFESEYTRGEEIANSITHGIGAALGIAGLVVLLLAAGARGDAWRLVGCSIYGACLVALYLISTLYHSLPMPRVKRCFRIFDHSAIYFLIAGTYTPFVLVTLRGPWGWTLFGIEWGLCALGVVFKAFFIDRYGFLSGAIYVAMGWLAVIAFKPLIAALDPFGFQLLLYGGVLYTAGVPFYALPWIPWNHLLWHLFVLAGSAFQYFAILLYVIP